MVKITKLFLLLLIACIFITLPKKALASDGTAEMLSTTGEDYRCFAASLFMQDANYTVIVSCVDLLYATDNEKNQQYVVWATPVAGGDALRLGVLGFGKVTFRTKLPFSNLFVSLEDNPNIKEPTGQTVMRGNMKPVTILRANPTSTPQGAIEQSGETDISPTPTPSVSTRDRIVTGLRRAGVASLFALFAVLGLVFILTRPRS